MKYFAILSVFVLIAASTAQQIATDENCDRILNSMVDGSNQIRQQIINQAAMEPKVVCCTNFRYTMAVQSVKAYSTVAKATRICNEKIYDNKIADLESSIAIAGVKTLCEKFETQTCITEPVSNAWNSAVQTVQNNYNQLNVDQIGEQIGKNWNQAISSLSNFYSNIGNTISQQNIPGRIQDGATALQSQLRERTKQLTDMVSGQGANRYSLVGDEKGDSLSLDSIVHSVIPEVEIVEAKPTGTPKPEGTGKRFSLMDWFGSLSQSVNLPGASNSAPKEIPVQQRANPYSVA